MGRFVTSSLNAMSTAQVGNYCQVKGRRYSNTYRTTLKVKDNSLINSTRLSQLPIPVNDRYIAKLISEAYLRSVGTLIYR